MLNANCNHIRYMRSTFLMFTFTKFSLYYMMIMNSRVKVQTVFLLMLAARPGSLMEDVAEERHIDPRNDYFIWSMFDPRARCPRSVPILNKSAKVSVDHFPENGPPSSTALFRDRVTVPKSHGRWSKRRDCRPCLK